MLSAQGFGLFFDCELPDDHRPSRRLHASSGKNIRTFYFIDGPTPAEAVRNYVRLTGLPPMHPAWALGYEQSTRAWMGHGELDFVTTYFREKHIPVDGFDLLTTYGGEGGIGAAGRGFHAGYLDYYQGWHPRGNYKAYNPKLLPNGAADIQTLRQRGFRPIVHGYWVGDFSDEDENEKVWQDYKQLLPTAGRAGGWMGRSSATSARGARTTSPMRSRIRRSSPTSSARSTTMSGRCFAPRPSTSASAAIFPTSASTS